MNQSQFPASRPLMGLSLSSLASPDTPADPSRERLMLLSSTLGMRALGRSGTSTPNSTGMVPKLQNGDARPTLNIMTDSHVESPSEGSIAEVRRVTLADRAMS